MGFEPTRGDPIGLAGRRLSHSAKVSMLHHLDQRHQRAQAPWRPHQSAARISMGFDRGLAAICCTRHGCCAMDNKTVWPSGLRRWLKAPFRKGVGSNPTAVTFHLCHAGKHAWWSMPMHLPLTPKAMRHRRDSNPCGQSPMDFESISLATRTQCLSISKLQPRNSMAPITLEG